MTRVFVYSDLLVTAEEAAGAALTMKRLMDPKVAFLIGFALLTLPVLCLRALFEMQKQMFKLISKLPVDSAFDVHPLPDKEDGEEYRFMVSVLLFLTLRCVCFLSSHELLSFMTAACGKHGSVDCYG